MKKNISGIIASFFLLTFILSLSGCSESTQTESSEPPVSAEPVESDLPSPSPTTDPSLDGKTVSEDGVVGNWKISFAGASREEFSDGKTALIIFYDFTNNSDMSISPFMALNLSVYQLGVQLDDAHTFDTVPYQHNSSLNIRPGTTIRCSALYEYSPDDGRISITIGDWQSDTPVVAYKAYDPDELPGETSEFEIATVESPTFTDSLSDEMTVDDCHLTIHSEYASTTSWEGGNCIRVSVDFENNSDSVKNFTDSFNAIAYQDNIELEHASASDEAPEDSNSWLDIQPGSSVTLSLVYALRSTSPVEFEVAAEDGTSIGVRYDLAE